MWDTRWLVWHAKLAEKKLELEFNAALIEEIGCWLLSDFR
jgi:hypothetical protein